MGVMPDHIIPGGVPSGTVTFVFTDIEGSTARWDRHPSAMALALRRHDDLLRAAIVRNRGHVFKTIGDAFCAAFSRPEEALAAVVEAQHALLAEDFSAVDGLRVRAAIHTGTADERDGDYFGPAVNRVARLLAIGHGGQVLVSGVTADLVHGALPAQARLHDLGEHRLRDLARPEYVYQLLAPGLSADFPPLRSLDALPNNLPSQVKSFVGREAEIAALATLLEKHRLVTLVGSGGVGKTRTSLQLAANLLDGWPDGVWFVELAPLSNGDYLPTTIAQTFGISLPAAGDPVENLARAVKAKAALLVFDNCEHLVDAASRVIAVLLRGCPRLKVLASSRQALGIDGEATFRLSSLSLPEQGAASAPGPGEFTVAALMRHSAIALFVERAGAANHAFSLTAENAPIVVDICRRLDGIPLAIELAASRVHVLSPRQLRDRLDERFRVLTGGSRDVLPRQQTLRALIDWSYDLLDARERTLFRRLGIFVNGFTLEGAVAAGSGANLDKLDKDKLDNGKLDSGKLDNDDPDLDELDVFELLASLVDKSLVLAEPAGDALRYRLLESTRAYALEKLDASGERALLEIRHLRYLRDRFAELWARLDRTGRFTELEQALAAELEDVRAALDGALVRLDLSDAGELLADSWHAWRAVRLEAESARRCEIYLAALPDSEPRLRARLASALSLLVDNFGQKQRAFEIAAGAVADARASGDASTLAHALTVYARVASVTGRLDEMERALLEAEAIPAPSAALRIALREAHAFLGLAKGDLEAAARAYDQQRKENRALGNARGELSAAANLAETEHYRGDTQRAIAIVREAIPIARSGKHVSLLASHLQNLASYLVAVDELPEAVAAAREAIVIRAAQEPDHPMVSVVLEALALVHALRGDFARAASLEGYAERAFARHGYDREFTEATTSKRLTALLREGLGPEKLARLLAEGATLQPEAAIALALGEVAGVR